MIKNLFSTLLMAGVLATATTVGSAAETAPKTVIHIVTVAFKEGTKPEQITAALEGAKKMATQNVGINRVWTKAIKVQNPEGAKVKKTHVIVMEFASEQALKDYAGSEAQKEWYKAYTPIREVSTTYDVTN